MQLNLLEEAAVAVASLGQKKRRRIGWEPVNHACRHCGGRVLLRESQGGSLVSRCSQCDATAAGGHDALCCCGEEVEGLGRVWECFLNPTRSRANPQIVLVRERAYVRSPERGAARPSRAVHVAESEVVDV